MRRECQDYKKIQKRYEMKTYKLYKQINDVSNTHKTHIAGISALDLVQKFMRWGGGSDF